MAGSASAVTLDLLYEFDGNANDGLTSFGTVDLVQDGAAVDVTITANTTNLVGGDIHEFYFNLPGAVDVNTLVLSDSGGVSNQAIGTFTLLGANPSITGGAGASFDTGVGFGNGGGPPGNGTLTTATFSLTATGGLLVGDFLTELSSNNNTPDTFFAVHFQSADVFNAGSETVGHLPEPGSLALLGFGAMAALRRRR
ncbi:PEP-CTERM sorting domain-containing protein [Phycisphaeraceae bacterium D3-23]